MIEILVVNKAIFSYLSVYARWSVGGILLLAGLLKSRNTTEFNATVEAFRVVPTKWVKHVSWMIVFIEFTTGASLVLGIGVPITAVVASALFFIFSIAVSINLFRKNILKCNCFGPYFNEKIGLRTVIRTSFLIALCLFVARFYDGYFAIDAWLAGVGINRGINLFEFALLTMGLIFAMIIIFSIRTILLNFKITPREPRP